MTREEIEELKGLAASMGLYDDKHPCKRAVILGKAIKALEQETVSKESYDHEYFLRKKMEAEIDHLRRHISKLETQITLEQEPRKGEWLRMSDLSEKEDDRYQCSYCGNVVHYKSKMDLYTFNSWCGRCGCDNDWRKCIEGN